MRGWGAKIEGFSSRLNISKLYNAKWHPILVLWLHSWQLKCQRSHLTFTRELSCLVFGSNPWPETGWGTMARVAAMVHWCNLCSLVLHLAHPTRVWFRLFSWDAPATCSPALGIFMDSSCKRPYINLRTVRVNIKLRAVSAFSGILLPHRLGNKVLSPVPHAPQRMHGSQARPDACLCLLSLHSVTN